MIMKLLLSLALVLVFTLQSVALEIPTLAVINTVKAIPAVNVTIGALVATCTHKLGPVHDTLYFEADIDLPEADHVDDYYKIDCILYKTRIWNYQTMAWKYTLPLTIESWEHPGDVEDLNLDVTVETHAHAAGVISHRTSEYWYQWRVSYYDSQSIPPTWIVPSNCAQAANPYSKEICVTTLSH